MPNTEKFARLVWIVSDQWILKMRPLSKSPDSGVFSALMRLPPVHSSIANQRMAAPSPGGWPALLKAGQHEMPQWWNSPRRDEEAPGSIFPALRYDQQNFILKTLFNESYYIKCMYYNSLLQFMTDHWSGVVKHRILRRSSILRKYLALTKSKIDWSI